ncbi:MAG: RNase adapter RapZ [Candidatus Rokuibacteriota bacterium]|nr:MAG: RNase adapter RapZ [Candidatus Rokubacteria bacterium]
MSSPAPRAARLDAAGAERPRLLIITGLSGAGKSYAIKCFEDLGYYCVDNLPTTLIPTFAELAAHSTRRLDRIALGVDIREREYLHSVVEVLAQLRAAGYRTEVLFLEASEETLVRRYQETRRRHPVSGTLLDGIRSERTLLANLRELADRVIDTSHITVHQLRNQLVERYGEPSTPTGLSVNLVSFGYKYGIPYDADLVLDCRFLPNPFFVEGLKAGDGREAAVRQFVVEHPEGREFLTRVEDLLDYLLPRYQHEGKAYLTVAIGCTGGRHRSVALVEELRAAVEAQGVRVSVTHRDVDREG